MSKSKCIKIFKENGLPISPLPNETRLERDLNCILEGKLYYTNITVYKDYSFDELIDKRLNPNEIKILKKYDFYINKIHLESKEKSNIYFLMKNKESFKHFVEEIMFQKYFKNFKHKDKNFMGLVYRYILMGHDEEHIRNRLTFKFVNEYQLSKKEREEIEKRVIEKELFYPIEEYLKKYEKLKSNGSLKKFYEKIKKDFIPYVKSKRKELSNKKEYKDMLNDYIKRYNL